MIYDVEFFLNGKWNFHNQETELYKAINWAQWLAKRCKCETRIVER